MSKEKRLKSFYKNFAYYDRTGMQEFLEQKASEGWRLVKRPFAGEWEFECTDPQKLHYAITYLPQFSNEDSFLLSDKKKEYLDLCAASGWRFVCAYKNMVIFSNDAQDPLPLQTDPEVELATIHKSFLKHSLPTYIISFALFSVLFFKVLFSDTAATGRDLGLAVFAVLSVYTVMNFCGYLRWRKKALAAAATGEFIRSDVPDKLLSNLFEGLAVLCAVIVIVKSIITGNWGTLILMALMPVFIILYIFTSELKEKADASWKKHIINIILFLIHFAAAACGHYVVELF